MANNRELSQFASLITIDDSDRSIGINTSVGIGTTIPQATLHVVGDTLVTGVSTFNTDVYVVDQLFVGGIEITGGGSAIGTDITTRNLNVTGISTFSNGPVLIGSGTSTGTASQPFQVTGGAYVSGSVGIGTTNPAGKLTVVGGTTTAGGELNLMIRSSNPNIPATITGNLSSSTLQIFAGGMSSTSERGGQIDFVAGAATTDPGTLIFRTGTGTGGTSQPERVRIDSSGNVGIGTTNPVYKTHILDTATTGPGAGLLVQGGGGGLNIAKFERTIGGSGISIDVHGSGGDPQIAFTRSGITSFAIGLNVGGGPNGGDIFEIAGARDIGLNTRIAITTTGNLGVGTTNPTSRLQVQGDARVSGVVTATTFIGALTGIAASATKLVTPRTFEITGDVVATAISFDGTGNVSLAATIQPNSVGLGTDTTGDYVRDITGTSNQITVTGGTGEGSTPTLSVPNQFTAPQDVTVTRDLQVNRNLNVNGNITIGGTSATLFTTELKVYDPDIVLGFRTDGSGNDVSNDTTANHGGVALASTEGNPLVQLFIAGIETNPATYKKFMWFKSGTFSGLGTDAWLSNYAVGIGSTQVPLGVRLAAGSVQFTERDLSVVRNINASGIITATTFIGNLTGYASTAGIATYATSSGISTYATSAGIATYATTAGIATVAQGLTGIPNISINNLNVSGISTVGFITASNLYVSGIATVNSDFVVNGNTLVADTTNNRVGIGTTNPTAKLHVSGGDVRVDGTDPQLFLKETDITNTPEWGLTADSGNFSVRLNNTVPYALRISTNATNNAIDSLALTHSGSYPVLVGSISSTGTANQTLQVSSGGAYVSGSVGIGTTNPTSLLQVNGNVLVSGVSTFTNGPILIGSGTSTGTANQPLQVTGGAYVSGSLGIGTTNPGAKLIVANNAKANIDNGLFLLSSSDATNPFQLVFSRSSNTVSNPYYAFQPVEQNVAYRNLVLNNLGGNVTIGSTLDTGTASQPLQVTGSVYISGNLGVGVTNPGAKLVVDGDVRLAGLDAEIEFNTGGARLKGRTNALSIHTGGGLDTETSEQVRINTTGVGIGTTNPGTKLNVVDNSSSDAVRITQLGAGNALVVEDSTNPDATPFVINAGGAVGIGTTNPSTLLHLNSTDPTIRLRRSDAAANAYGEITSDTSGLITLKSDPGNVAANSGFSLTVDNTERVRVSAAGSVGIGTTNPTAALTIATVGSATTGASQIYLNGATSNRIDFNINGVAVPATVRSAGTKIVLYPNLTGGIEYAIGVEPNHIWQSVPAGSTAGFKWYGGTTELAVLKGDGNLGIGTTNPTVKLDVIGNTKISGILTSSLLNVGSGGTIITTTSKGLVGIGTTNAQASLHLVETDFSIYDGNVASQKSSVILSNSGANDNLALYLYDSNTLAGNTTATLGLGFAPGVDPNNLSIGGYLNNFGERLSIDEDGTIELKGSGSPYGQFSISQTTNQITFLHNQRSGGSVIGYGKFSFQNAPFEITGTNSDLYVAGITTVNSNFVVNGNTLVADATNNRVGIGTTLPQSALDVRGAVTLGIGTVGINSIFSTTDIQSWQYTNKSTAAGDTAPLAVYIGAAGTTLFVVGDTANAVIQYTLSTPYDVSTAGAAITTYSVATQDTNPTGIDFNSTGTKMFISGQTGVAPLIAGSEYVHEYSLSVAWDLSPTSIVGYTTSYNITQDTSPQGVTFGNNGSKMYVVGNTNDTIYQYSLSTPYSLATGVTYDNVSLNVGTLAGETTPVDISFNSTGTILWVIGQINDRIYQFNLGTAWDISTAVFYDDIYIGFNEITPQGLQVLPEQNVAYIVGSTNDTVYQYSTNTPTVEVASSGISTSASIVLNNETRVKDKLYVKGAAHFDSTLLMQGTLTVDGAATVASNLTVSGGTITAGNVATALLSGNTTTGITLGQAQTTGNLTISGAQTTGTINIGAAAQTGAITIGLSSASQTLNLATGASGVGTTKTINLGTGGVTNSFTRINIGPTAGVGTITINSGTNLGIGTINPLTTLQVGSVGVAGSSVFAVTGIGSVGIGTTLPVDRLTVFGRIQILQDTGSSSRLIFRGKPGNLYRWNIDNDGNTNNFRFFREDDATAASGVTHFQIDPGGNTLTTGIATVGLGATSTPPSNSQLSFELTTNTNLRIKVRGTDGILRTANITLG